MSGDTDRLRETQGPAVLPPLPPARCPGPNGDMTVALLRLALPVGLLLDMIEAKKYCWYFEGGYPIYFICRSYEDCCGTRCCVRALSIQRLWYFWLLLMMAVLFCCGAGFFIRRRMYPSPLRDEPAFNVSFTRHPAHSPVSQQPVSMQAYRVSGVPDPGMYPVSYPPPPSYCNHPPPSYEQIFQNSDKT